jgi:dTDP-L-rhamnose 4-epimerase
MTTTALVTGGAGLIGSHVVDQLRAQGLRVRVLDSLVAPTHRGRPDWLRDDVDYVFADVRNRRALAEALRDVEILFHLAAFGGFAPGVSPYFDVNVTAYCRLLEVAAATKSPLARAVIASSQAVYGEGAAHCVTHGQFQPGPRSAEDLAAARWEVRCPRCHMPARPWPTPESADHPVSPYALSKHCLEKVALTLGPDRGVATTILRFALTYGPRQSATNPYCGIVAMFTQRLRRGQPILIYEDGLQTRDFINVRDVARANVAVAFDDRAAGRVFNVGTGAGTSILELTDMLGALVDVKPVLEIPGWYRTAEVRHLWTDGSALAALGWKPAITLADGLADFVDWSGRRPIPSDPLPRGIAVMRRAGIVRMTTEGRVPRSGYLSRRAGTGRTPGPAGNGHRETGMPAPRP